MVRLVFEHIPIQENDEPLVDLRGFGFLLEPLYFKQGISPVASIFLREGIAKKLQDVERGLQGKYRFKIWDGFRSRSVQNAIYSTYFRSIESSHPDWSETRISNETEKFVTMADDTSRIPPHATGGAVDLTLVDAAGDEVDMGTEFDFFGDEAATLHYETEGRDKVTRDNRRVLRRAMEAAGFSIDKDEWWHFDYGNQIWAENTGYPVAFYGEVTQDGHLQGKMV